MDQELADVNSCAPGRCCVCSQQMTALFRRNIILQLSTPYTGQIPSNSPLPKSNSLFVAY